MKSFLCSYNLSSTLRPIYSLNITKCRYISKLCEDTIRFLFFPETPQVHKQCSFSVCPGVCQGDVRDCQERRLLQIVHEEHNQGLFIVVK